MSLTIPTVDRVFCTTGGNGNLAMSYKPPKNMHVDVSMLDEYSGELSRHTPDPSKNSPLCLLEVKKDPRIIDRFFQNHHMLHFNAYIMMPGCNKKDKVQAQILKMSSTRIVMPVKADNDYTVLVNGKEISHYVTRVGAVFKLIVQMENCTLDTIYQDGDMYFPQSVDEIHTALFVKKNTCKVHLVQQVATVKITLANIPVERYAEKFLVSLLFGDVPTKMQEEYKASVRVKGEWLEGCVHARRYSSRRDIFLVFCVMLVLDSLFCDGRSDYHNQTSRG